MNGEILLDLPAREIHADSNGFESLGKLHGAMSTLEKSRIGIDCKRLSWIDAQLGACLLSIVQQSRSRGNSVQLYNLAQRIQNILRKNRTLLGPKADTHGTAIPVASFSLESEVQFAQYTREHLKRKQMPKMSNSLREKFFEGIDELFANSSLHSLSKVPVFACGQFFPRLDKLTFLLCDGGRGIPGSLAASQKHFSRASEAIEWAMELNNSSRTGDIPGGLGLGILKDFIKQNKGKLRVCSHTGYWELSEGRIHKSDIASKFPGTVISLEINTADRNSYSLSTNVNPHEIW